MHFLSFLRAASVKRTGYLFVSLLVACGGKDEGKKPAPKAEPIQIQNRVQAQVQSLDGQSLGKATILIGTEVGKPFAGNFFSTDDKGNFEIPDAWTTPLPITIAAKGYVRTTFLRVPPTQLNFRLRRTEGNGNFQLKGLPQNFEVKSGDGFVDFAAVFPALQKRDLFSFDVGQIVSSLNDEMTVIGQKVKIPSNISLPKQRETYIFPLTLEKPMYRMTFRRAGPRRMVVLRGQFPLKKVVDQLRENKEFVDVINDFSMLGGSLRTVDINSSTTEANLPVNDFQFSQSRKMLAPDFNEKTEMVLSVALTQNKGELVPSDVKNLVPKQGMNLQLGAAPNWLLTVLKNREDSDSKVRVSAAFLPFQNQVRPQLLGLMADPRVKTYRDLQIPAMNSKTGIRPSGMLATLWTVENLPQATPVQLSSRWDIYSPDWERELSLPLWPQDSEPGGKLRWGVTLLGQSSKVEEGEAVGPAQLDGATHATHVSIDF